MASDKLRRYILEFQNKCKNKNDYENWTVPHFAACPIFIDFCDASANSRSFSDAVIDFSTDTGLPLGPFFRTGHRNLTSYLLGEKVDNSETFAKLEAFISNEKHTECLLSLHQNEKYNEFNIQVILAAHLFAPLAGDNSYKIGKKGFPKDGTARRCPNCNLDVSAAIQNTSLGNSKVWHGHADILVKRSAVKIVIENNEDGSDEPLYKRMRLGSTVGDEDSSSDESYDSENNVKVQKDVIGSRALSQGLAQTIVNGFSEVKKNSTLSMSFVPSFIATGQNIRICMYNCGIDRLIMSENLDLFLTVDCESVPILDFKVILSLWYALNFDIYFDKLEPDSETYLLFLKLFKKSKFVEQARHKYLIYKECCTKPMTGKAIEKDVAMKASANSVLLMPFIKEMVEADNQVNYALSHKT